MRRTIELTSASRAAFKMYAAVASPPNRPFLRCQKTHYEVKPLDSTININKTNFPWNN